MHVLPSEKGQNRLSCLITSILAMIQHLQFMALISWLYLFMDGNIFNMHAVVYSSRSPE
jgi:hypothetical protein